MKLLYARPEPKQGCRTVVSPGESGLDLISFGLLSLREGESFEGGSQSDETVLVVLTGTCCVECGGVKLSPIGVRGSVFEGHGAAAYLPRGLQYTVTGGSTLEAALCCSPARNEGLPYAVGPHEVRSRLVGQANWQRRVDDLIGMGQQADRLLVGETLNPPGNWSSYPPHKHDKENLPVEVRQEEVYHFRVHPAHGFGLQRLFTEDGELDEVLVVRDGDTVVIPRGYHPVAAAPGYQLYYLWTLAGETRAFCVSDHPAHVWVKHCEPILATH